MGAGGSLASHAHSAESQHARSRTPSAAQSTAASSTDPCTASDAVIAKPRKPELAALSVRSLHKKLLQRTKASNATAASASASSRPVPKDPETTPEICSPPREQTAVWPPVDFARAVEGNPNPSEQEPAAAESSSALPACSSDTLLLTVERPFPSGMNSSATATDTADAAGCRAAKAEAALDCNFRDAAVETESLTSSISQESSEADSHHEEAGQLHKVTPEYWEAVRALGRSPSKQKTTTCGVARPELHLPLHELQRPVPAPPNYAPPRQDAPAVPPLPGPVPPEVMRLLPGEALLQDDTDESTFIPAVMLQMMAMSFLPGAPPSTPSHFIGGNPMWLYDPSGAGIPQYMVPMSAGHPLAGGINLGERTRRPLPPPWRDCSFEGHLRRSGRPLMTARERPSPPSSPRQPAGAPSRPRALELASRTPASTAAPANAVKESPLQMPQPASRPKLPRAPTPPEVAAIEVMEQAEPAQFRPSVGTWLQAKPSQRMKPLWGQDEASGLTEESTACSVADLVGAYTPPKVAMSHCDEAVALATPPKVEKQLPRCASAKQRPQVPGEAGQPEKPLPGSYMHKQWPGNTSLRLGATGERRLSACDEDLGLSGTQTTLLLDPAGDELVAKTSPPLPAAEKPVAPSWMARDACSRLAMLKVNVGPPTPGHGSQKRPPSQSNGGLSGQMMSGAASRLLRRSKSSSSTAASQKAAGDLLRRASGSRSGLTIVEHHHVHHHFYGNTGSEKASESGSSKHSAGLEQAVLAGPADPALVFMGTGAATGSGLTRQLPPLQSVKASMPRPPAVQTTVSSSAAAGAAVAAASRLRRAASSSALLLARGQSLPVV
eukprot:TRINITY_DN29516_c0_g1_i1.p1 TRINITY_DN29516_c0_g1~~TRINITY_DN29516_c0_g1_i1.p1  ORF type:complete len:837 (-),score=133.70 TRINITY_DN29516_c0_g1_i1:136-2646(-)